MDKRYQVFVSSTFKDLEEERDTAVQTLMKIDSIPAGMELFPAADIDQFEYIKTIIDGSDYYVLIIGGKYGTVTEEGVSYTEKEYDYALEQNIPVLAFLHRNPDILISKNVERTQEAIDKLAAFRDKASNGRLVEFWENKDQLASQIIIGMTKATKMFPRVGWVRANTTSSIKTLSELIELRKKNDELELKIKELSNSASTDADKILNEAINSVNLYGLSEEVTLYGSYYVNGKNIQTSLQITLAEIFRILAPEINNPKSEVEIHKYLHDKLVSKIIENEPSLGSHLPYIEIPFEFLFRCRVHFVALQLMKIFTQTVNEEITHVWELTNAGRTELVKEMAFTHEDK